MLDSIRISVKVHPGSSKRGIVIRDDGVHLYTTSKPLEGRANRDARDMLADYFHVPKRHVSLFRGERSRQKIFRIEGTRDGLLQGLDPTASESLKIHLREV
jgi:uncharacterized protein (TIGR00251 family)